LGKRAKKRHKSAVDAESYSRKVSDLFKIAESKEDQKIAAREAVFAYHTAKHNFSFRSNDCSSSLIRSTIEQKFHLRKSKTSAVITKVISPMLEDQLEKQLDDVHFITITTDTSNRGSTKMLPVAARFFDPMNGIQNKKLQLITIPNETSDTQSQEILKIVKDRKLEDKVVGFAADNTSTNHGGVTRNGPNHILIKIQKSLKRDIIGIGCSAHITHNSIQSSCDQLPINFEAINFMYRFCYFETV
jgi:hypothetical protein